MTKIKGETKISKNAINTTKSIEKVLESDKKRNFEKRNEAYLSYIEAKSPKGSWLKPLWHAFLVGGTICVFGQVVGDIFKACNPIMNLKTVASWINVIIISLTTITTGLGVFDKLGRFAGAGTVIPITGFANSITSSAMEFKKEGLVFGVGAKMFYVAGPVIVNGVTFSIIVGLLFLIFGI